MKTLPSPEGFRKARWIRRKRSLIGFFIFLAFVLVVLFFDYYMVAISKFFAVRSSKEIEEKAGELSRMSDKERHQILSEIRDLMASDRVEEARVKVLKYLERENSAEGNYLAATVYLRQGDFQSAYRYLKEAVRLNPDYYEAKQKLAELYLAVGDFQAAQKEVSFLKRQESFREEGLLIESEISITEGKFEEALSKIERAVEEGKKKGYVSPTVLIKQAVVYAARGNLRQAREIINAIDTKKLDPAGFLALARYYKVAREDEKVLPLLQEAAGRFPQHPEIVYYYALELLRSGSFKEAAGKFKQVFSAMPNSRLVAYRYGQALMAAGRLEEASEVISNILSKFPSDILGLSLKVRLQLLKRDYGGAIETLKKTIALVPEAPRPHTLMAEIYWNEGVLSLAEKYATLALKLGEKSLSPHFVLGDVYLRQGRLSEAVTHYSRILEREPTNIIALSQMADIYANMGHIERAVAYLDKILLHYPQIQWMQRKKELLQVAQKGPQALFQTAKKHLESNPEDPRAKVAYVQALMVNNRLKEAGVFLEGALKKEPRNQWYLITLGDLLLARGDVKEARSFFERAIELNPHDVNLLLNIGMRYEKINLDYLAEELYLRAHGERKDSIVVINQLAWFYVDKVNDLKKARPWIETLRLKGEGAYEKDTIGWYYYKLGDYKAAEDLFREALEIDPNNHVIRAHYAVSLYRLGKVKQAEVEKNKVWKTVPAGRLREELVKVAGEMGRKNE